MEKKEEIETNAEVEVTNTDVESPKRDPEVKIPKSTENVESPKPDPDLEVAVIECIPPVRPERQKRQSVKIPEWTPPKNDFFSYLFSCFKPRNCD